MAYELWEEWRATRKTVCGLESVGGDLVTPLIVSQACGAIKGES